MLPNCLPVYEIFASVWGFLILLINSCFWSTCKGCCSICLRGNGRTLFYWSLHYCLLHALKVQRANPHITFSMIFFAWCVVSQLRNLVWATTKHDVYTMHDQSVTHWSSLEQTSTELINADDCIVPKQVYNLLYFFGIQYFCAASYSFWFGLKYPFLLLHRGGMVHSQWQWSRSQQWPWIVIYW